jgi:hypothetical protein
VKNSTRYSLHTHIVISSRSLWDLGWAERGNSGWQQAWRPPAGAGDMAGKRTAPLSGEEQRRGGHGFRGHRYYSVARAEHDVAVVTAALTHVVCAADGTEPPAPQQLGTRA